MIRARGSRWQVRVYAGTDDGRKQYIHRSVGTYAEAKKLEREIARDVERGRSANAEKITVADLCARWLDRLGANLSPTTLHNYRGYVDRHIVPHIGTTALAKLTTEHLDRLYDDLRGAGLAEQSIKHVHAIVRRALNIAIRWGYLTRNVAELATPPAVPKSHHQPPTPDELRALFGALEADVAMFFRLAAVTGCRRGELCGLRWTDVDLDAGGIVVARALISVAGRVSEKGTKSDRARAVGIDDGTVELLREHLEREQAKAARYGVAWRPDAPVFTKDPGRPWNPDLASHRFRRAAKRAGVTAHLHDLRHWAASYGTHAGFSARQVADRLGHSDATLVHNRYGHSIPAADRALADSLGALLD